MASVLNLVRQDDVLSCEYEVSRYPDGQQSIRIVESRYGTYQSLREQKEPNTITMCGNYTVIENSDYTP
jgi:hypothetical protein